MKIFMLSTLSRRGLKNMGCFYHGGLKGGVSCWGTRSFVLEALDEGTSPAKRCGDIRRICVRDTQEIS